MEYNEDGKNDFICTNAVTYYIRDNCLQSVVQMRSNDVVFGYKNDYAWQLYVLEQMVSDYNDCKEDGTPELKVGEVEKEIAAKISYLFKMNGAEGDSYESIIGSGYLGALPHARPTEKKFEKGDFVVMDFGALYNGYHADMTRTVVIGEATGKHKEIYDIVLKSQLAGIDFAKSGITGAELDNACREVIDKSGYGDKFIHSTGHGIGLEVHTYPRTVSYTHLRAHET